MKTSGPIERTTTALKRWLRTLSPNALPPGAPTVTASPTPEPRPADDAGQRVADLLKPLVESGRHFAYFDLWEEHGFHVTRNHFYDPIPDTRTLSDALWEERSPLKGVDMNVEEQLRFLQEIFPQFAEEYNAFPTEKPEAPHQYYFNNSFFGGTDALVSYCMARHFAPSLMIEVGSGFSTYVAAQAARRNGHTELVCIEPYPQAFLKDPFPGVSDLIEKKVQAVDLSVFDRLKASDILFIDTSHIARIGSDVNFLFFEVLPALNPGVVVHVHDIFLPGEYPRNWVMKERRFWNEQYLLHAFLLYNTCFKVLFANSYMGLYYREAMQQTFPRAPWWGGGSFWMQKGCDA